jgi:hypothetical protein
VTIGPDNGLWLTLFRRAAGRDGRADLDLPGTWRPQACRLVERKFRRHLVAPVTSAPLFPPSLHRAPSEIRVGPDRNVISARVATDGTKTLVIYSSTVLGIITGTELRSSEFDLAGNR